MHLKSLLNNSVLELRKAVISTPELDVRVLLVAAMAKQDAFVYSHPDFLVTNAQYAKFRRYIRRRKERGAHLLHFGAQRILRIQFFGK